MQSCPSTDAPIQRLPTENLVDIFLLHADTFAYKSDARPHFFRTEVERLANLRLLTLSQVCSRWHTIAIDTPIFWTKMDFNGVLWGTPSNLQTTVALLVSALKRGRDLPLILEITDDDKLPPHPRIFHLLASQSRRWASVTIFCAIEGIYFSGLEGKLPMLQKLQLDVPTVSSPNPLKCLKGTPVLRGLYFSSPLLENISTINLQHLFGLGCQAVEPTHIARSISLLSRLTTGTAFSLSFTCNKWSINPNQIVDLQIAPQTSAISVFSCAMFGEYYPQHSLEMLGQILASLTMPALREIRFWSARYPRGLLEWSHAQFLALCARSGFQHSLKILKLSHVGMTEAALVEVLSVLISLEQLQIADKRSVDDEGADVVLITDTLLCAITCAASNTGSFGAAPLVPRLSVLRCASRLQFTHNLLLDFVSSRLEHAPNCAPFRLQIRPLTEADGHFDPEVHARLQAMWSRKRRFVYYFGSAKYPVRCGIN
ncbi:hypothetical protein MVEN_01445600 [Mycena venus]|uniref:F-box domain-containing protein n=1 Tax=Mycena venus TaxID=2733690 RepID=A0A8H7CST4_9AGAR|nr:hypothetical protein MVEN_01445600 [Mycena venus]